MPVAATTAPTPPPPSRPRGPEAPGPDRGGARGDPDHRPTACRAERSCVTPRGITTPGASLNSPRWAWAPRMLAPPLMPAPQQVGASPAAARRPSPASGSLSSRLAVTSRSWPGRASPVPRRDEGERYRWLTVGSGAREARTGGDPDGPAESKEMAAVEETAVRMVAVVHRPTNPRASVRDVSELATSIQAVSRPWGSSSPDRAVAGNLLCR
jgi:hypothetical protein